MPKFGNVSAEEHSIFPNYKMRFTTGISPHRRQYANGLSASKNPPVRAAARIQIERNNISTAAWTVKLQPAGAATLH